MSEVALVIGNLHPGDEEYVLGQMGLDLEDESDVERPAWARYDGRVEEIALLNLATVVFFTNYVFQLQGLTHRERSRSRFKNLPEWENNIWLPTALDFRPRDPLDRGIFIGSALALRDELTEIRRLSDLELGAIPPGYEGMRAGQTLPDSFRLTDDRDCVRWVWRGLWDGADLAVRSVAPMSCFAA
jgi:hypothetical protein